MSGRARSQLQKLRRKLKSAGVLADKSNVSRAALSRILSGKSRPSARTIFRLASHLDTVTASELIGAFLSDQIPEHLRPCIRVELRQSLDAAWRAEDRLEAKIESLPLEVRQLIEQLIDYIL
jgi:transcriptional regulator with XRE-family HTH domain